MQNCLRAILCSRTILRPRAIWYARANLTATQNSKVKRGCFLQVNIIFLFFYSNTCHLIFKIEVFGTYLISNLFSEKSRFLY